MYFLSAFLSVLRISITEHFIVVALLYIAAVPEWLHVGDAVLGGEQADIPTPCYTPPPTHTPTHHKQDNIPTHRLPP